MPIYPRELKSGKVVYDVVVAQGRKRIWRRGLTEDEAKKVERHLSTDRDRGINIAPDRITVEEYLNGWIETFAKGKSASTYATYCTNLRTHIIPFLGKKRLRDLRPADVQKRYGEIMETRSKKTCLNVHRVLHEALGHAVRLEIALRNVCDAAIPPTPDAYRIQAPTIEEIERTLAAADTTQYGTLTRVALWCGLRQGELLRLRWPDVDLDQGVLYVRGAKHGSDGAIVLSEPCIDLLIAHRATQGLFFKLLGPAAPKHDYVFTNTVGQPVDAGGLKRTWQRLRKKHAIMRFHDLRHAHASLLIKAGVHAKVIQERLRHKQISTTMDIYGHLMPGLQAEAAKRIQEALVSKQVSKDGPFGYDDSDEGDR